MDFARGAWVPVWLWNNLWMKLIPCMVLLVDLMSTDAIKSIGISEFYYNCTLPPKESECGDHPSVFFYDTDRDVCQRFNNSLCGSNGNSFHSEKDCQDLCLGYKQANHSMICTESMLSGSCKKQLPRYFYDHTQARCRKYYFSGCDGNRNRFLTLDDCETFCNVNSMYRTMYLYIGVAVGAAFLVCLVAGVLLYSGLCNYLRKRKLLKEKKAAMLDEDAPEKKIRLVEGV